MRWVRRVLHSVVGGSGGGGGEVREGVKVSSAADAANAAAGDHMSSHRVQVRRPAAGRARVEDEEAVARLHLRHREHQMGRRLLRPDGPGRRRVPVGALSHVEVLRRRGHLRVRAAAAAIAVAVVVVVSAAKLLVHPLQVDQAVVGGGRRGVVPPRRPRGRRPRRPLVAAAGRRVRLALCRLHLPAATSATAAAARGRDGLLLVDARLVRGRRVGTAAFQLLVERGRPCVALLHHQLRDDRLDGFGRLDDKWRADQTKGESKIAA